MFDVKLTSRKINKLASNKLAVKIAVLNFKLLTSRIIENESKHNRTICQDVGGASNQGCRFFKGIINRGSFSQHRCPNHACVLLCRITLRINKLVVVQLDFYAMSIFRSRMEKCDNSSLSKILVDSLFLRHRLSLLVFIFKEENKCSLSVKIHRKKDFDRETLIITVKNNSISATIIIPKIFLFICERR